MRTAAILACLMLSACSGRFTKQPLEPLKLGPYYSGTPQERNLLRSAVWRTDAPYQR